MPAEQFKNTFVQWTSISDGAECNAVCNSKEF